MSVNPKLNSTMTDDLFFLKITVLLLCGHLIQATRAKVALQIGRVDNFAACLECKRFHQTDRRYFGATFELTLSECCISYAYIESNRTA